MINNKKISSLQDGCVYYFLMDEPTSVIKKHPIYKIMSVDFLLINELTNIKKLQNIKKYKIYYYVYEPSSKLKINGLNEGLKNSTSLFKYENRELIYLKHYLKTLSSSTKYVFTIIDFYKRLLKSIDLLISQNIYHNHINFDTIVVDKHIPLLSNFSFSLDTSRKNINTHIEPFFMVYDLSYLERPLELHILSYLITNNLTGPQNSLSSYNIENIICDVVENNNILKTFSDTIVSSYKQEALEYFKKYINKPYDYILSDILQYSNTWDNYALSILFLRILIGLHRSIEKQNKFIIMFMKLLVCNIHLNPFKRLSINTTTNKFDAILNGLEIEDYKEILDNLVFA